MSCKYKKTLKKRIAKEALPFIINYCESCLKRNQQRSFVRYVDQKSTEAINVENISYYIYLHFCYSTIGEN
jgi:hypothetical protein